MRRNPGKATHLRRAKAKLESARGQYRSVQAAGAGEAGFRQEILLLAHMTAAQAVQEAANAGATTLRDNAYHLQQMIESHLSRLRTPGKTNPVENPSVRRFADYPVAKRDAARKAKRTDTTHYVYELSQNPRFAVMSEDHPVQQSYENGVIGLGKAKLRHTARAAKANPKRRRRKKKMEEHERLFREQQLYFPHGQANPRKNPYETKRRTTVAGLGLHKDEYTYRGHRIKIAPYGGRAKGLIGGFLAAVTPGDLGNQFSPDRDSALELARLLIDRNEYVQSLNAVDRRRFEDLDEVMRWFTTERHPLTREHVARQIEDYRRGEVVDWEDECAQEEDPYKDDDCVDTWKILKSFEFFDALPLSDRLRWVDSVVKEARLRRGLPAHNPDSADKRKAKKIIQGLTPIPEHITIQRLPPGPEPPSPLLPYEGAYYMGGSRARKTRGAASGSGAHRHPLARPARKKKKKKDNPDRRAAFRRMMRL